MRSFACSSALHLEKNSLSGAKYRYFPDEPNLQLNLVHKATAESSRTAPQSQNPSERKSVLKINATGRLVLFADRFIRVRSKSLHLRPLASWHVRYLVDCMLSVGVSTAASSLVCRTRFESQLPDYILPPKPS